MLLFESSRSIDRMRDLTIEDPTDQLQRLRDVHVKACLNLPELMAKVQTAAVEAARAQTQDAQRTGVHTTNLRHGCGKVEDL